jgi:type VI secretion system secreted protein Hcp
MKFRDLSFGCFLGLCIFNFAALPAAAYLRLGGLAGDSKDSYHQDWFDIISFDQGPYRWTQKDDTLALLPKESKRENGGSITVVRNVRNPYPEVYEACVNGTYFGAVTIEVPVPSEKSNKIIRLSLSDVLITEVNVRRPDLDKRVPIEQITMSFDSARWERPFLESDNKPMEPEKLNLFYKKIKDAQSKKNK